MQERKKINKYQKEFSAIMAHSSDDLINDDVRYNKLVEIVQFLRSHSDGIRDSLTIDISKLIFLVGATGAGKSTLINYLKYGDSAFVVSNDKGEIQLKDPNLSISKIGTGSGSTTLIPQVLQITGIDGSFIDAPGNGDTTGMLADIINSTMMTKMTAKIQEMKIIFVTKQSSLNSGGGYGAVFKKALEDNIGFFHDMNTFKDSIGIVIAGAGRRSDKLDSAKKDLRNMLNHEDFAHKDLIKFLLDRSETINNIQAFSEASRESEMGEQYASKFDQQQNEMKGMVQNLPFSKVPNRNYFDVPSCPKSRETMSQVLEVIKMKGGQMLHEAITKVCPLKIYALEIKPFLKYLSGFIKGYKSDLITYVAILKYNNYFALESLDNEKIKKMDIDIKFISSYVSDSSEQDEEHHYNWSEIAKVKGKFFDMHKDLKEIDESPGYNFMKYVTKPNISTKPAHESLYEIKKMIEELATLFQERDKLEILRNDQTSEYYQDKIEKVFSHMRKEACTKTVTYQERVLIGQEDYVVRQKYTQTSSFIGIPYNTETKYRPVTKLRNKYALKTSVKEVPDTKQVAVHKNKTIREFNSESFVKDQDSIKHQIESKKEAIEDKISQIPVCDNVEEFMCESYSFQGEDANILLQCQGGEAGSYGLEYPNNSLEEVGLDNI